MTTTRATVTINSLHVLNSSVNTTAEPGSNAEWHMTFNVNGDSWAWSDESVKDNKPYATNRSFDVDLNANGTIIIQVSGYEEDSTSANDVLPTLVANLEPAQDFQLGGTFWLSSPDSQEGTYKIQVTVMPAKQSGQALTIAREYVGLYRAGKARYALWSQPWAGFTKKWKDLSSTGLRLARLSAFPQDSGVLTFGDSSEHIFTGIFEAGDDGHALYASEWPAFEAKWKELSADGLRLVDIAPYLEHGKRMFAGVYRHGTDAHALWVLEWPAFEKKWEELSKAGLRLIALDTYVDHGKRFFAGAFRHGTDGHALWVGNDWKAFRAKWKELTNSGLRLIDLASYVEGNSQRFAGVFRAGGDAHGLVNGNWDDFIKQWSARSAQGQRLIAMDTFMPGREE